MTALAVGGLAAAGVAYNRAHASLDHAPAFELEAPSELMQPVVAQPLDHQEQQALTARLDAIADASTLGNFGAVVTDLATGETLWDRDGDQPKRPASSTKVLTASAAILQLGAGDRITTEVVAGDAPGEVIIKAAGDVWLTDEAIDELAAAIQDSGVQVDQVSIDVGAWPGERILEGWNAADIDAGFVAPLEPAMLYGARTTSRTGDVPRSHTPAYDVAVALAQRLDVDVADDPTAATASEGSRVLATTQSPTLAERIDQMMLDSDNVMAEALARELAAARGSSTDAAGATAATLSTLAEHGFSAEDTTIMDNSGLSVDNLITPRLLDQIMYFAATQEEARSLLASLPVAGASGTLADRYDGMAGRGWVRAKTGTLDETSALVGVVTSEHGHQYTFAFISNGADVMASRAGVDRLASALRES